MGEDNEKVITSKFEAIEKQVLDQTKVVTSRFEIIEKQVLDQTDEKTIASRVIALEKLKDRIKTYTQAYSGALLLIVVVILGFFGWTTWVEIPKQIRVALSAEAITKLTKEAEKLKEQAEGSAVEAQKYRDKSLDILKQLEQSTDGLLYRVRTGTKFDLQNSTEVEIDKYSKDIKGELTKCVKVTIDTSGNFETDSPIYLVSLRNDTQPDHGDVYIAGGIREAKKNSFYIHIHSSYAKYAPFQKYNLSPENLKQEGYYITWVGFEPIAQSKP